MKKLGLSLFAAVVAVSALFGLNARRAESRAQYKKEFIGKYVKAEDASAEEKAFAELVAKANCQVCHAPGDDRKKRNEYGQELAKLLRPAGAKGNEKDAKKIDEALDKVAELHVDPKDPKSPTYGDILKAHKLPVEVKADAPASN